MADTVIELKNAGDSVVWKAAAAQTAPIHEYTDSVDEVDCVSPFISVIQTGDGAITTLQAVTIDADNVAVYIEIKVLAMETDGSDRAIYHLSGIFYRNGGAAVQQGITVSINTTESDAAWDCVFDVNGNDVRVRVTGVGGQIINWKCITEYVRID